MIRTRTHLLVISALCAFVMAVPMVLNASTPPGTEVTAVAEARYQCSQGNVMPTGTSNTVKVVVSTANIVTIGEARKLPDGQFVQLHNAVVTAGTAEMGGSFYMQAENRSAGILVATNVTVRQGDVAAVCGTLATTGGERRIDASNVEIVSSGTTLPSPLGIPQASLVTGVDSAGLLVSVWGRVTSAGSGYIQIDDGSGLTGSDGSAGIRVYGDVPSNLVGKFVSVTGIPGTAVQSGTPIVIIRIRSMDDVSVLSN